MATQKKQGGRTTAAKKKTTAQKAADQVVQPLAQPDVDLSAIVKPEGSPALPGLVAPEPPKWSGREMLDRKTTLTHDLTLCLDSNLAQAKLQAQTYLVAARELAYAAPQDPKRWEAVGEAILAYNDAVAAAVGASVKLVARGMPRPEYDELCRMEEHRPQIEHQDEWREKCEREGLPYAPLKWNPHTFPPALISQCMHEPALSYEEAVEIWEEWSDAEAGTVFDLCLRTQKVVY